ncbi:tyrosine-type recombinase/integrase [Ottowia pentelensis]|uniref:Tyrosine-type recombinase/integrase n=1 Tax=Ottowia pentelensis TaxID=511108 RepID=A0ABV6PWD7_9BURK
MALTDTFVKQVKPTGRSAGDKYSDGGGLFLHVMPTGSKYWRLAFRHAGKQRLLALGVYPAVSLAKARKGRDAARELLADGQDPGEVKREASAARAVAAANTFELVAREYHKIKASGWSEKYAHKWLTGMESYLFPALGRRPIGSITARQVLDVLRLVEKRGILDTAHTLRQNAGQVFRFAVQTERSERNPVADLSDALQPLTVTHMAAVTDPKQVGELLRAMDAYTGHPATRIALQLSALLFQRPGNIRAMEWAWVNLEDAMLTIPAEAMKRRKAQKINGRPHFVPLAPQAVTVLRELHPLTGHGRYVFPSLLTGERPMSDNTINTALRRLGYSREEMTAHGFRAMARTVLGEQLDADPQVIEAQLAHGKSGPLGAAYDRTSYIAQRRDMMVQWADYLDKLRVGADVIPIGEKTA